MAFCRGGGGGGGGRSVAGLGDFKEEWIVFKKKEAYINIKTEKKDTDKQQEQHSLFLCLRTKHERTNWRRYFYVTYWRWDRHLTW